MKYAASKHNTTKDTNSTKVCKDCSADEEFRRVKTSGNRCKKIVKRTDSTKIGASGE